MPQTLILAKNIQEANQYAKAIALPRFTYRPVRHAGSIRGVRNAEVHLLSGFARRPDRFAILDALRWARSLAVYYVDFVDGEILDGTEGDPRFIAGPNGTDDVKNPVDDDQIADMAADAVSLWPTSEETSEPSPAPESSEGPAPAEEPRGRTRRRRCSTGEHLVEAADLEAHEAAEHAAPVDDLFGEVSDAAGTAA